VKYRGVSFARTLGSAEAIQAIGLGAGVGGGGGRRVVLRGGIKRKLENRTPNMGAGCHRHLGGWWEHLQEVQGLRS